MANDAPYELFARAGDEILRGDQLDPVASQGVTGEVRLARRLHEGAQAGIPDPEFIAGLRQELRLSVRSRLSLTPAALRFATMETSLGVIGLAYRNNKVLYCSRVEPSEGETAFVRAVARDLGAWPERDEAPPAQMERAVRDHLAGRKRFTAVDLSALTPFQQRVLEKTAEIPRGEVRPYGWVAREIGAPGATRAVGTALGHNPIPFLIPCHRVVRSDGTLGEYSGGGPDVKARVLEQEGAPVDEIRQAAQSGQRYRGSRTTHIVCYPTCHAARRIQPENIVPFASLAKARDYGYRPCALCRPA